MAIVALALSKVVDFGSGGVGGYPEISVENVVAPARIRVVYATHPDGLGEKGDFWHETRANYMGDQLWLPILPASTDRFDVFEVKSNGIYRASLAQGLVRYARWKVESGAAEVTAIRFVNDAIHSEESAIGSFNCSDIRYTRVWEASVRTCQLAAIPGRSKPLAVSGVHTSAVLGVSLPYLSDGAKRDRLVWSGDLWWAQRNMYAAFPLSSVYMPGSLRMLAVNHTPDGYVQACPFPEALKPLAAGEYGPFASDEFAAWFIPVLADHVLHTGDMKLAEELMPTVEKLVSYLISHSAADLIFEQRLETCKHSCGLAVGGTSLHHRSYMNVLLWKTYTDAASLATWLGKTELALRYSDCARRIAAAIRGKFWNCEKGALVVSLEESKKIGFEANALALATRFATAAEAKTMLSHLKYHGHGKFQLLAVRGAFEYADGVKAKELIEAHNWTKFVADDWQGVHLMSECLKMVRKGWGDEAHPDTAIAGVFSNYLLGVIPLEPGYRRYRVEPVLVPGITWAKGKVPTPWGALLVEWKLVNGKPEVKVREERVTSFSYGKD